MKPAEVQELSTKTIPFVAQTGLQILEARRGYVKCRMPIAGNGNHVNIMYAGALCTLAEFPGGVLYTKTFDVNAFFPIVKSVEIKFVNPAISDIDVEIEMPEAQIEKVQSEAAEKGKADFVLDAELKAADGTVVALSHIVYQLRKM